MLNAATKTTAVLFPVSDDRRTENGPLFSGSIKLEDTQIPLAAFLKDAESGESQFLDLAGGAAALLGSAFPQHREEERQVARLHGLFDRSAHDA